MFLVIENKGFGLLSNYFQQDFQNCFHSVDKKSLRKKLLVKIIVLFMVLVHWGKTVWHSGKNLLTGLCLNCILRVHKTFSEKKNSQKYNLCSSFRDSEQNFSVEVFPPGLWNLDSTYPLRKFDDIDVFLKTKTTIIFQLGAKRCRFLSKRF